MRRLSLKHLIMIALLIALQIIFTRFLSFDNSIVRIGATFIPLALCSMMFGPISGGIAAAMADVIGVILFYGGAYAYFPGFTLTAFLSGVVYGIFLFKNPQKISNYIIAVLIVSVVFDLALGTLWLSILMGKGYLALLPSRILKCVIMTPVEVIVLRLLWKYLEKPIRRFML